MHCWDRCDEMKSTKVLQSIRVNFFLNVFKIVSIKNNLIVLENINNDNRFFLFSEHASFQNCLLIGLAFIEEFSY